MTLDYLALARRGVAGGAPPARLGPGLQPRLDRRIAEQLSKSSELLWVRFGRLRQRRSGDQQSGERDDQKQPSAHVGATACHSLTSRTCNASLLRTARPRYQNVPTRAKDASLGVAGRLSPQL